MIKLKKLISESPDTVYLPRKGNAEYYDTLFYKDNDAVGFLFDAAGNFHVTAFGESHVDIPIEGESHYEGRAWRNEKVVSFWEYPKDANMFRKIAKLLEDETSINILSPGWKIEVNSEHPNFAPGFVSTRDYAEIADKIVDPSQQEYQKHLDRMKTDIPAGWGSKKRPANLSATQRHQIKSTSENKV